MEPNKKIPLGMSVQEALSEGEVDLFDLATSSEWEDPEIKELREEYDRKEQEYVDWSSQFDDGKDHSGIEF